MRVIDVIITKRDGGELTREQIDWFISTYSAGGTIADEQAAALVMAIFLNGMVDREISDWTRAMIASGTTLDLGHLDRPSVDKHSTGGVGDKVSLVLVPLVAACGAAVPQLSGRGLGHTGGTLDKMEAIPGWRGDLSADRMRELLGTIGGFIAGATTDIAPADRLLYALRDVTGTIESIPLIASSIMSKKVAEGADALVLDVKVGRGAFMGDLDRARALAGTMVELGTQLGVRTSALITGMDDVLGCAVGNALEVQEALDALAGGGPADLVEVTVALAEEMCRLAGIEADPAAVLASGAALDTFIAMVEAQGGDLSGGLPAAEHTQLLHADRSGWVQRLDARSIGVASWKLGAGRARKEDPVSATAGIRCLVKPGDEVEAGEPVLELCADDRQRIDAVAPTLSAAVAVGDAAPEVPALVIDRIVASDAN